MTDASVRLVIQGPLVPTVFPISFVAVADIPENPETLVDDVYPEDSTRQFILSPEDIHEMYTPESLAGFIETLRQELQTETDESRILVLHIKLFELTGTYEDVVPLFRIIERIAKADNGTRYTNKDDFHRYLKELLSRVRTLKEQRAKRTGKKSKPKKETETETKTEMSKKEFTAEPITPAMAFQNVLDSYHNPVLFQETSRAEPTSKIWVLPNRKNFPAFLQRVFKPATESQPREAVRRWNETTQSFDEIRPFSQQKYVSDYLSDHSPYRGLLLYHGLGSGKSGASIAIAEGFRDRRVVVMLPASLHDNYLQEIYKYGEIAYKKNFYWVWVPLPTQFFTTSSSASPHETDMEPNYVFLESKGVPRELAKRIIRPRGEWMRPGLPTVADSLGVFMVDYTQDTSNYDTLSESDRQHVNYQIEMMLRYKYTILHYNAGAYTITQVLEQLVPEYRYILSRLFPNRKISSLTDSDRDELLEYIYNPANRIENPFDNKVLVVDEIHNLTSKMYGGGYNGSRLYELIMRAQNLKVVFLSGTPVINSAFELALMFNMLRGILYSYSLTLINVKGGPIRKDDLDKALAENPLLDRYVIRSNQVVEVIRNPHGFVNVYSASGAYLGVQRSPDNDITEAVFLKELMTYLYQKGYQVDGTPRKMMYTLFPDMFSRSDLASSLLGPKSTMRMTTKTAMARFTQQYIEETNYTIKNVTSFRNRIVGLISFFNEISGVDEETGSNIFPEKRFAPPEETEIYLSNYQFMTYAILRAIERVTEKSFDDANDDAAGYYRMFTRQAGIFAFPPDVARPKLADFRENVGEALVGDSEDAMIDASVVPGEIRTDIIQILRSEDRASRYERLVEYLQWFGEDQPEYAYLMKVIQTLATKKRRTTKDAELVLRTLNDITSKRETLENILADYEFEECDFMDTCALTPKEELSYEEACRRAIQSLTREHLTVNASVMSLPVLSPKYVKILNNMNRTEGLILGYSQFRSVEGIEVFSRILDMNGYTRLEYVRRGADIVIQRVTDVERTVGQMVRYATDAEKVIWKSAPVVSVDRSARTVRLEGVSGVFAEAEVYPCRYALWTGTESTDVRQAIQEYYNRMENMFGQLCLILLITQSGAEGISLHNIRQVHIMEPYWNNVRTDQVIGRARRIKSHIHLPKDQQNVTVFQYIAKYTTSQLNGTWIDSVSEEERRAIERGKENNASELEDLANRSKKNATREEQKEIETIQKQMLSASDSDTKRSSGGSGIETIAKQLSDDVRIKDHMQTSDEVLAMISKRKETLTRSFLSVVKETAVDCQFNREANVASDPALSTLQCYDTILTDEPYTYDIVTAETVGSAVSDQVGTVRKDTHGKGAVAVPPAVIPSSEPVAVLKKPSKRPSGKTAMPMPMPVAKEEVSETEEVKPARATAKREDQPIESPVTFKRIQLPFVISGIGKVQCMILVPSGVGNTKRDLLSLESGVTLFDFYTFYGLLPSQPLSLRRQHIPIGTLEIDAKKETITPVFSNTFKEKYDEIRVVEECMREIGLFPIRDTERERYAFSVRECVSKQRRVPVYPSSDAWKCIACHTLNSLATLACVQCGLPKSVSLEMTMATQHETQSRQSTTSASSTDSSSRRAKVNRKRIEEQLVEE